jgi:hypothetical protein
LERRRTAKIANATLQSNGSMRCYGPERSLIERQLGGDFGHVADKNR